MTTKQLGTERISKLFLQYTIPAVLAMIISGIQSMIDGMFLGNVIGQNAMASVNIANPFIQLIMASSFIISIGASSFMGRCLGEKNVTKAQNIFKTSLIYLTLISIILSIGGVLFSNSIAKVLGANELLLPYTEEYIRTFSFFIPFISLMFLFGFTARLIGKPKVYLYGSFLTILINVTLDYIFIYKLNFGVLGAALATGISYSSAFLVVIVPMLRKSNLINLYKGHYEKGIILEVLYNGSSEGVTSLATALSTFIFNIAFMSIAKETGVAAFTSISYIAQFVILIMYGISDGVGPLISYNYGFNKYRRVKRIMKVSIYSSLFIGVMAFFFILIFGDSIISIFIKDNQEVIDLAVNGSKIYAFAFLFNGIGIIYSGFFTAIGKAKESIIIAASRGIIFIFIGIMVLPSILGINGVWGTVVFAEIITFIIILILKRKETCLK